MSPLRRDTYQRLGGAVLHNAGRLARRVLCLALLAPVSHTVCAFTVTIAPAAPKTVYLQVGVGGFTGNYNAGGTPGNNATVNKESVAVAAAAVGNGTAQAMTTDSTVGASSYDGLDRKSTRLNSSHGYISYAVFCLKKKNQRACVLLAKGSGQSISLIAAATGLHDTDAGS